MLLIKFCTVHLQRRRNLLVYSSCRFIPNIEYSNTYKHSCLGRTFTDGASLFIYLQGHNDVHSYATKNLKCSFGLPGFEPFWLLHKVLHHLRRSKIKSLSLDSYTRTRGPKTTAQDIRSSLHRMMYLNAMLHA